MIPWMHLPVCQCDGSCVLRRQFAWSARFDANESGHCLSAGGSFLYETSEGVLCFHCFGVSFIKLSSGSSGLESWHSWWVKQLLLVSLVCHEGKLLVNGVLSTPGTLQLPYIFLELCLHLAQ